MDQRRRDLLKHVITLRDRSAVHGWQSSESLSYDDWRDMAEALAKLYESQDAGV